MVYCTVHQYTLTEHTSMYMYVIKFKYIQEQQRQKEKSSQLIPTLINKPYLHHQQFLLSA